MTDNRPKTVPFCKDCAHYKRRSERLHFCLKEPAVTDVVTGEPKPNYCVHERADPDKCGWEAKWFEAIT